MSGNTATPATMLAAGVLLAGLSSVLAAEPQGTFAEPALTEKAESSASPTKAKTCAAWWLHAPSNPPKTQKGKTGPTPEHKRKGTKHKPPPKSSQR